MAIADEVVQVLQVGSNQFVQSRVPVLISSAIDLRFHIRTIRRYHRINHLRCGQFSCRSRSQHECSCKFRVVIVKRIPLSRSTTFQVFAPIMGFSACFGGPMLNILLGVGISGSYIIQQTSQPYKLYFSPTLFVSTGGLLVLLLTTLVFVPFNGYFLTRRWGIFLIVSYAIIMALNVLVEVRG